MKKNIYTLNFCLVLLLFTFLNQAFAISLVVLNEDDPLPENSKIDASVTIEYLSCPDEIEINDYSNEYSKCGEAKVTVNSVSLVKFPKKIDPFFSLGGSYPHGAVVQVGFNIGHTYGLQLHGSYSNNFNQKNNLQTYGVELDAFFKGFHAGFFFKRLNVDSNLIAGDGVSFPLVGPSMGYKIKNCFKIKQKKISCDFQFDANFIIFPGNNPTPGVLWYPGAHFNFRI